MITVVLKRQALCSEMSKQLEGSGLKYSHRAKGAGHLCMGLEGPYSWGYEFYACIK